MSHKAGKGKISPEYWVNCGICQEEIACCERTVFGSEVTILGWGWKFKQKHGWICPGCVEDSANAKKVS